MGIEAVVEKLRSVFTAETEQQRVERLRGEAFEARLCDSYGIAFSSEHYPGDPKSAMRYYVSSLVLLDMLEQQFKVAEAGGVVLLPASAKLSALDIGAGEWHYVRALYSFLKVHSGSQQIRLDGFDFFGKDYLLSVSQRIAGLENVTYEAADLFGMPEQPVYDAVFAMHPLATDKVYEDWAIPYRPLKDFWVRALGMVKPGGILFGCGHFGNGGAAAFNSFPSEHRILNEHNDASARLVRGIAVESIKGFDGNVVMIARKGAAQA